MLHFSSVIKIQKRDEVSSFHAQHNWRLDIIALQQNLINSTTGRGYIKCMMHFDYDGAINSHKYFTFDLAAK